jgi:cell division protein ZipA
MDKTQLQWLLAGIGAVVVVLIYLWGIRFRIKEEIGKRRRRPEREPVVFGEPPNQPDPLLNGHDFGDLGRITPDHHLADKVLVDVEIRPVESKNAAAPVKAEVKSAPVRAEPPAEARREACATEALSMTVVLTVMAPQGRPFEGPRIQAAAEELDLRLNADGLFERFPDRETASGEPVFGVAHLRKPGAFELRALQDLSTPGLLLFMNLPGPLEGTEALDLLVISADHLARNLGGTICDERHNRLTNPMLLQLRGQIADLERRWLAQLDY